MIEVICALIALVSAVLVATINGKIGKIEKYNKENWLTLQKLTLMNTEMPMSERIAAGKLYVDHGGNGDCKAYFHQLLEENGIEDKPNHNGRRKRNKV